MKTLIERINTVSDPVLDGLFDQFIKSMAKEMVRIAIQAASVDDLDAFELWSLYNKMTPEEFMTACASHGVNIYRAEIATHNVSGRDAFIMFYRMALRNYDEYDA